MPIPISYNIRNLRLRKGLTIMTALGIALTVTTAIFLMASLAGLKRAFVTSGEPLKGAANSSGSPTGNQCLIRFSVRNSKRRMRRRPSTTRRASEARFFAPRSNKA